jgi:hypothetical protein
MISLRGYYATWDDVTIVRYALPWWNMSWCYGFDTLLSSSRFRKQSITALSYTRTYVYSRSNDAISWQQQYHTLFPQGSNSVLEGSLTRRVNVLSLPNPTQLTVTTLRHDNLISCSLSPRSPLSQGSTAFLVVS